MFYNSWKCFNSFISGNSGTNNNDFLLIVSRGKYIDFKNNVFMTCESVGNFGLFQISINLMCLIRSLGVNIKTIYYPLVGNRWCQIHFFNAIGIFCTLNPFSV